MAMTVFWSYMILLVLCAVSYYYHAYTVYLATIVLFHLYLMGLWLFFEQVFIWTFTLISIIYFALCPGFSISVSISLFFLTFILTAYFYLHQKRLDKQNRNYSHIVHRIKELERERDIFSLNMDNINGRIIRVAQFKILCETLSGQLNVETIVRTVTDFTDKYIGTGNVLVRLYLFKKDMKSLELYAEKCSCGMSGFPDYDPVNIHVLRTGKSVLVSNIHTDNRFDRKDFRETCLKSCICSPLITGNKIVGIVRVDSPLIDQFTVADQKFLSSIAVLAALAVSNAQLYAITRHMAVTDGLTGLFTHSQFKHDLEQLISRQEALSVLFIDVDHFKQLNDTYGHAVGDRVLMMVAGIIVKHSPDNHICARYGGEEFAVILPCISHKQAYNTGERIRQAVEKTGLSIRRKQVRTTVSMGLAHYPLHAGSAQELLKLVDKALYRAKKYGKNRIETVS